MQQQSSNHTLPNHTNPALTVSKKLVLQILSIYLFPQGGALGMNKGVSGKTVCRPNGSHAITKAVTHFICHFSCIHYPISCFLFSIIGCIFIAVVGGYLGNGTIGPIPRSLHGLSRGVSTQVSWK